MMSSSGQTPAEEEESVEMEENGHEKSTPTYCLFVGDLSLFCNESDLQVAFSPFGEISEVRMKRNKVTKRHLSYGFVEYTQPNAAVGAMNEMNGKLLNGRALKIRWANSLNTMKLPKAAGEASKVEEGRSISVYVAFSATIPSLIVNDEYLRTLFGAYGKIEDVSIKQSVIDRQTHCQRGYSFVCFEANELGMQAALRVATEMKEVVLDGINYRCEVSRSLTTKLDPQVAAMVAPAPKPPKQPKTRSDSRGTLPTSHPSPVDEMMSNYGLTLQQPMQYHQQAHRHQQAPSHYAHQQQHVTPPRGGGGNYAPPQQQPSWMPATAISGMPSPLSMSGYWPNGVAHTSFSPPPSPHKQNGGFNSFAPQIMPMYASLGSFAAQQGVFAHPRGNNSPTLALMGGMNNMGMNMVQPMAQTQPQPSYGQSAPIEQRNFRETNFQQQYQQMPQPSYHHQQQGQGQSGYQQPERFNNANVNNGYGNRGGRPPQQQQRPVDGGFNSHNVNGGNGYY